jgi:predicted PurR-regulated permease PerM
MTDYLEVLVYVCFSCILILFFLLFCIYGFLYIAHVEESENINLLARKLDTQQHLINTQAHQFSQLVSVVNRHMHSIVIHNNDNERPQFQPCTPSSVLDPRKHTNNGVAY